MVKMKIAGVVGRPIINSRSPEMHNSAIRALGLNAHYLKVVAGNLDETLSLGEEIGIVGFNITSPFKEAAVEKMRLNRMAEEVGAVNLALQAKNGWVGKNTDVQGVLGALSQKNVSIRNANVLILGAGGAAKAAVAAISKSKGRIAVANRSIAKARKIAKQWGCESVKIGNISQIAKNSDIIISCLPVDCKIITGNMLSKETTILEAKYGHESTLREIAKKGGANYIDGREWLLMQGAASFRQLFGKAPPLDVMRKAVSKRKESKRSIALTGFMGSGKSSVAKDLGNSGFQWIDTDQLIEKKTESSIPAIFERVGEGGFRELERELISDLDFEEETAISLGGGSLLKEQSLKRISVKCHILWLWSDLISCLGRIRKDSRPLIDSKNPAELEKFFSKRKEHYASVAEMVISTKNSTSKEVANLIKNEMDHAV